MKTSPRTAVLTLGLAAFLGPAASGQCLEPDNGFGTATMPPASCTYLTPNGNMRIVDGLPLGSTIEIDARIEQFNFVNEFPGGSLAGTRSQYSAVLVMIMNGTGGLKGFQRQIHMPLPNDGSNLIDSAPRTNTDVVQPFVAEIFSLRGEVFGDPDFCTFRVNAGFGQNQPVALGATVIQAAPANTWQVDSFFDVTYAIEFQGCPGSILEGFSGTTIDSVRFTTDPCPTDLNNDGVTDTADLGILISNFGTNAVLGDLNGDGVVDTADLGILIGQFGQQCFPV